MNAYTGAPKVSVLMPVYNAGEYLVDALESIAAQTWRNFEVVAVDDASTDGSAALLAARARQWPWLRVVFRERQGGIAAALNTGFDLCRGELVARMDADDICLPERLSRQVAFLNARPEVGMCGGAARLFGMGKDEVVRPPVDDDAIRAWLVFGSAFVHPAVMFRRGVAQLLTGPYSCAAVVEDYDLWLRLAAVTRFQNLSDEILRYRVHHTQYTATKTQAHHVALTRLRLDWLSTQGIVCNDAERAAHVGLAFDRSGADTARGDARVVARWLTRLCRELPVAGWCRSKAIRAMTGERWWSWMRAGSGGFGAAMVYGCGPLGGYGRLEACRILRLMLAQRVRSR